ncbi:hypothetical protein BS78_06G058300 [Paspalum vaginatum]|nr:hypothetical protein BS78_06G058300 [Paspalum vaginatum]
MALLPRKGKMDHFMSLYENLVQVRTLACDDTTNSELYYAVVDNIPVGKATQYEWTSNAPGNRYIKKVYDYQRDGRPTSVFGLLDFVRVIFGTQDKYSMIETCFNGVFHQFHKAMADAGFKESKGELDFLL